MWKLLWKLISGFGEGMIIRYSRVHNCCKSTVKFYWCHNLFFFFGNSFFHSPELLQKTNKITFSNLIRIVWIKVTGSFGVCLLSILLFLWKDQLIISFAILPELLLYHPMKMKHAHNNSKEHAGEKYRSRLGFCQKERNTQACAHTRHSFRLDFV